MDLTIIETGEIKSVFLHNDKTIDVTISFLTKHGFFDDKITFIPESSTYLIYQSDYDYLLGFIDGLMSLQAEFTAAQEKLNAEQYKFIKESQSVFFEQMRNDPFFLQYAATLQNKEGG